MTTAVSLAQSVAPGVSLGFKNRIINGGMTIDQRNAGASVSAGGYPVDRFNAVATAVTSAVISAQQVSDAPTGFNYSLKYTVTTAGTAYTAGGRAGVLQRIEGYNFADFMYGSANAQTSTLSFWVKSSMTGSFSAALYNNDGTRSYPFSYTISVANTWEQKSVTIAGDTTGTWLKDNGRGVQVEWCLGAESAKLGTANTWASAWYTGVTGTVELIKTLNATFQITGVQLEKGTTATPFEFRDYGRELMLCQRYFQPITIWSGITSATNVLGCFRLQVPMRANPSLALSGPNIGVTTNVQDIATTSASIDYSDTSLNPPGTGGRIRITGFSGLTASVQGAQLYNNTNYPIASAEL